MKLETALKEGLSMSGSQAELIFFEVARFKQALAQMGHFPHEVIIGALSGGGEAWEMFEQVVIGNLANHLDPATDFDDQLMVALICVLGPGTPPPGELRNRLLQVIRCSQPNQELRDEAFIAQHVVACGGGNWRPCGPTVPEWDRTWPEAERAVAALCEKSMRTANQWLYRRFGRVNRAWPKNPLKELHVILMHSFLFPEVTPPQWPDSFQLCEGGRARWQSNLDAGVNRVATLNTDSTLVVGTQVELKADTTFRTSRAGRLRSRPIAGGPAINVVQIEIFGPTRVCLAGQWSEVLPGKSLSVVIANAMPAPREGRVLSPDNKLVVPNGTRLLLWCRHEVPAGCRLVVSGREDGGYYTLFTPDGVRAIHGASLGYEAYLETGRPPSIWNCSCGSTACRQRHRLTGWAQRAIEDCHGSGCVISWKRGKVFLPRKKSEPIIQQLDEGEALILALESPPDWKRAANGQKLATERAKDENAQPANSIAVENCPRIILRRVADSLAISLWVEGAEGHHSVLLEGGSCFLKFSTYASVALWKRCSCGMHVSDFGPIGWGDRIKLDQFIASAVTGVLPGAKIMTKSFVPGMYFSILTGLHMALEIPKRGGGGTSGPVVTVQRGVSARLRKISNIAQWNCPCATFDVEIANRQECADLLHATIGYRAEHGKRTAHLQGQSISFQCTGEPLSAPLVAISDAAVDGNGGSSDHNRLLVPTTVVVSRCGRGVVLTARDGQHKLQIECSLPARFRIAAPRLVTDRGPLAAQMQHTFYYPTKCARCGLPYDERWTRTGILKEVIAWVDVERDSVPTELYECRQCGNLFDPNFREFLKRVEERCLKLREYLAKKLRQLNDADFPPDLIRWVEQEVMNHGSCQGCVEGKPLPCWCPLQTVDHSAGDECLPKNPKLVHVPDSTWLIPLLDWKEAPDFGGKRAFSHSDNDEADKDPDQGGDRDGTSEE